MMKWGDLFEKWGLTEVNADLGFAQVKFEPQDPDRRAAWELYAEMLTRITTCELPEDSGTVEGAFSSLHTLFGVTRSIMRAHFQATEFSKLAVLILNHKLRPLTSDWHAELQKENRDEARFRQRLKELQPMLRTYCQALGIMAGLEEDDLTQLAQAGSWGGVRD